MVQDKVSVKKIVSLSFLFAISILTSHYFIYKGWIVPQLPSIPEVPISWWFLDMLPSLLTVGLSGLSASNKKEIFCLALLFSIVGGCIGEYLTYLGEPGHLKNEGPALLMILIIFPLVFILNWIKLSFWFWVKGKMCKAKNV